MKDIEETGCNFGAEMELKSGKNLVEVNKIREESNERLRNFLYWFVFELKWESLD